MPQNSENSLYKHGDGNASVKKYSHEGVQAAVGLELQLQK